MFATQSCQQQGIRRRLSLSAKYFVRLRQRLTSDDLHVAAVMEDRHDLQADVAMRVGNDADDHRSTLFVEEVHRFLDERRTGDIHRLQFAQIGQKTKSTLQLREAATDLLQASLGFLCLDYSVVSDHKQTFQLVDFEVNHSFKRLYFFNNSRSRSCGSASTR